jgi:hypothetical protein
MNQQHIVDRLMQVYNRYVNYDREVAETCMAAVQHIARFTDTRHDIQCLEGKDE